jgi:hypothetical protein
MAEVIKESKIDITVQRCKGAKVQRCKGAKVQRLRTKSIKQPAQCTLYSFTVAPLCLCAFVPFILSLQAYTSEK